MLWEMELEEISEFVLVPVPVLQNATERCRDRVIAIARLPDQTVPITT